MKVSSSGQWLVVGSYGVILGFGCADGASSSDPFSSLPQAFARGSSFSFYADEPGLWESSDPAVARIIESDARRARVRFESAGSSQLVFFGVDDETHEAQIRVRDVASVTAIPKEPLEGTRVLVGGSVRVAIGYRDDNGQPLVGADLLDAPSHRALTPELALVEDALVLSPTTAEAGDVPLTIGGDTLGRLQWEAVASESVEIILSLVTVDNDCQIVAELWSDGARVVGWRGLLRWDHKPLWLDDRVPCAEVGEVVTVTLGAASASITR